MMKTFKAELSELKSENLLREIYDYEPIDATHVLYKGKKCLMMASNNYLGLTHDPKVIKAAAQALTKYGTGSGGSRLTTGSHPLFQQLEEEIRQFKGSEASIIFNTGYMANLGTISTLTGPNDLIFSDELNHASIIDGCRLSKARVIVYRHTDMTDLAHKIESETCSGNKFILTDSVFSMDGDIAPLPDMVQIADKYKALIMVDDAHATGVIGETGGGSAQFYKLKGKIAIQMGTLSKALASEGGYIAGSQVLIDYIKNKARSLIYSTALAPATIGAAVAALKQIRSRPELLDKLHRNSEFMRNALMDLGFSIVPGSTPILAVLIGDAEQTMKFSHQLLEAGIVISGIRPPTVPKNTSRLRLTVSTAHTLEDLELAVSKFKETGSNLGLI